MLLLISFVMIAFIHYSGGFQWSFPRKRMDYHPISLHMFPEISKSTELTRNTLISLCDEYKDKEEALRNEGYKPRKLRDTIELRAIERKIEINILKLSAENPTKSPLSSWGFLASSQLDGAWKLRFTTALDAKPELFNTNPNRITSTSQYINASTGIITNIIKTSEKPDTVLSVIQVSVKGKPLTENRLQLAFQSVNVLRPEAFLFRDFSFPFPRIPFSNYFIDKRNARNPDKVVGPYFDILYLDDDLRIHRTGRGDYFVQTRLYDMWDPMVGWKQISLL